MFDICAWAERTFACIATSRSRCHQWLIIGSEHFVKAYANNHSLTATAIVDLIKNVLKNPEFDADEVDTDMLQRLQAAIDRGDLQVLDMHKQGDGPQI